MDSPDSHKTEDEAPTSESADKGGKRKRESDDQFEIRSFDVLPGKGRGHIDHPGNQYFHTLVSKMMVKYAASTSKAAKGRVQQEVVQTMKDMGGRFLKHGPAGGITEEMDDAEARSKVGQALRYRMKHGPLQEKSAFKSSKKVEEPGHGCSASNANSVVGRTPSVDEKPPAVTSSSGVRPSPNGLSQLEHILALKAAATIPSRSFNERDVLLGLLSQSRPGTSALLGGNPYSQLYQPHLVPGILGRSLHPQPSLSEMSGLNPHFPVSTLAALIEHQQFNRGLGMVGQPQVRPGALPTASKRIRIDCESGASAKENSASYEPPSRREEEDVALLLTSMAKNS